MQNLQCVFRSPQNYNKIDIFIWVYCCWSCPLASTLLTNTSCMISWDTGGVLLVQIWRFSLHICLNDLLHLQNIQTSLLKVQIKFFSVFRHLPVIFMMTGFSRWQRSKQAILNCFSVRIFLIILQYFNFYILILWYYMTRSHKWSFRSTVSYNILYILCKIKMHTYIFRLLSKTCRFSFCSH